MTKALAVVQSLGARCSSYPPLLLLLLLLKKQDKLWQPLRLNRRSSERSKPDLRDHILNIFICSSLPKITKNSLTGNKRKSKYTTLFKCRVQRALGSLRMSINNVYSANNDIEGYPMANSDQNKRINLHMSSSSPRSLSECVGVWKSVSGLSLQDGALLSALLLLETLVWELLCPAPGTGVSLKICKRNKTMRSMTLSIFPVAQSTGHRS